MTLNEFKLGYNDTKIEVAGNFYSVKQFVIENSTAYFIVKEQKEKILFENVTNVLYERE